jgi:hypothetical protein
MTSMLLTFAFGPAKDAMPYLIRRAEENTSVAGQTSRELEMIKAEPKKSGYKVRSVHFSIQ